MAKRQRNGQGSWRTRRAANLFHEVLDRHIDDARIRIVSETSDRVVGRGSDGPTSQPDITIRALDPLCFLKFLADGSLGLGESYMDGHFELERGTLQDFLTILLRNRLDRKLRTDVSLAAKVLGVRTMNLLRGRQGNVQRHYDIDDDLFESFLDSTMTYSCGFAQRPDETLEQLQFNKLERICQKLRLEPGLRLLDVGCGYGGLLIHAAKSYGVSGVGVTNSRHHFQRGNELIAEAGFGDRLRIEFKDYEEVRDRFDRVVSVGMLEHVPRRGFRRYFRGIANALSDHGVGLVHVIGCNTRRNEPDPFIQEYIFPGSSQPRLSVITSHLEWNRLAILDVENIVRHYQYTLAWWLERFQASTRLDAKKYDERFRRMWEYYLCAGIAASRASNGAVYQVLFMKDYTDQIPLQRV